MFSLIQKILFNTSLFLAILLSNSLLMINTDSFYKFEFNKNNTALKTGINENDLFLVVDNIQDFFKEGHKQYYFTRPVNPSTFIFTRVYDHEVNIKTKRL